MSYLRHARIKEDLGQTLVGCHSWHRTMWIRIHSLPPAAVSGSERLWSSQWGMHQNCSAREPGRGGHVEQCQKLYKIAIDHVQKPPLSRSSIHRSSTFSNCRDVERPPINPNCLSLNKRFSFIYSTMASLMIDSRILHAMLVKLTGL